MRIKLNTDNLNLRKICEYYPCHNNISDDDYDCRCCYCPLYEECSKINNTLFGGYLLKYRDIESNKHQVFACEKCTILHTKEYVDYYLQLKEQGLDNKEILNKLIEKYTKY